jgi:hypothetical protein
MALRRWESNVWGTWFQDIHVGTCPKTKPFWEGLANACRAQRNLSTKASTRPHGGGIVFPFTSFQGTRSSCRHTGLPARVYCGRSSAGELVKDSLPDLPSLYASKSCSSRSDHRLCLLVLKRPCSASLEHPSSSLLDWGSSSLESSSPLLDGSTSDTGAPTSMKQ